MKRVSWGRLACGDGLHNIHVIGYAIVFKTSRFHYPNMMESQKQHNYTIAYKLQVIQFAKENGNRAAARHFGPLPTEKIICVWRKQEEELQKVVKSKHGLRTKKAI